MPKKTKVRLPNKILPIPNQDKAFHESWKKGRNLLNFPHPYRACLAGIPNCGKGNVTKNLIIRAKPPFEEIFVIHPDADYTKEWDDVDATMLSQIPSPEDFQGEVKTLVVLDDLELKGLNKDQKRNLDRLFGYVSTHKNISVILTTQDAFNVPAIVRRCSNLFIFWRNHDIDSLACLSRKTGLDSSNLNSIFDQLFKNPHDSLWIDMTKGSPAPMRLNGYHIVTKQAEGEHTKKILDKMDTFSTQDEKN